MRLSIVNYGLDTGADVPKYAKREDDELIKIATDIIQRHNFGTGAAVVSEVFHTGLKNSNHRKYMEKGMDNSIMSFYRPHVTPFLMHHEMGGGGMFSDGNPNLLSVGSNIFAKYMRRHVETLTGPASGYGKVVTFVPSDAEIGGQRAIDALRSRRLLTVSLGARVSDKDYRCSICGNSLYDEECEHSPGKEYDEGICMAEVYNPLFREYSVVYNPSDIHAAVRRMDVMEGEGADDKYHVVDQEPSAGYIQIYDSIGKPIYPSAEVHSEGGKAMSNNATQSSEGNDHTSVSDEAVSELINAYEAKLKKKDEIIVSLATALRNRMNENESPVEGLNLDNLMSSEGSEEPTNDDDGSSTTGNADPAGSGEPATDPATDQDEPTDDQPQDSEKPDGGEPEAPKEEPAPEEPAQGGKDTDGEPGDANPEDSAGEAGVTDSEDSEPADQSDTTDPVTEGSDEAGNNEETPSAEESSQGNAQDSTTVDLREVLLKKGRTFKRMPPHGKSGSPLGSRSIANAIRRNQ